MSQLIELIPPPDDRFNDESIHWKTAISRLNFKERICTTFIPKESSKKQLPTRKGHGRYNLELNHTHYIFFDDGTCDSLDNGEFTSKLARQISRGARRRIPMITILIGGTLHAIESICTDLQKQIPVVIVDGSGQLANVLCKYLTLTE
ncbi:unnamed protein product, partial [Rotaria sordida]